jgi:nucleotide-binding universal stress UspA family protein
MASQNLNNTTLVPIDFSENSIIALEHAGVIAKFIEDENLEITLVYVIEDMDLEAVDADTKIEKYDKTGLIIEGARSLLKKIIDEHEPKIGTHINYIILGGKPYKKIAETAKKINADSIVMGTRGASGWDRIMGSNASRVVQMSPCPVIVINDRHFGEGYKNIVLPLDLTKETKQKVNWATKVGKYFDATIHIVSAAEDDEFLQSSIKANMKQVEKHLSKHNVKHTSEILTEVPGNFAKATLKHAENMGADLIIIMTQQERSFSEVMIGSYAQQIVNRSKVPVMCINPRADLQAIYSRVGIG